MEKLWLLMSCGRDDSCCCLSPKGSIILISLLNLVVSILDTVTMDPSDPCCEMKEHVVSMRLLLMRLLQVASLLLLLASIFESAFLVHVYICCTLGFIVMGFGVSILDFLSNIKHERTWSVVSFVSEVAFLFVVFKCLHVVDEYRKMFAVITLN